jgi:hypothetical protein
MALGGIYSSSSRCPGVCLLGGAEKQCWMGGGRGVFAISLARRWCRRIASSQRTPTQPTLNSAPRCSLNE